jgi:hypothetical protein
MIKQFFCAALFAAVCISAAHAHDAPSGTSKVTLVYDHELPHANASTTEPARLLAVFVVDTNEKQLTYPMIK